MLKEFIHHTDFLLHISLFDVHYSVFVSLCLRDNHKKSPHCCGPLVLNRMKLFFVFFFAFGFLVFQVCKDVEIAQGFFLSIWFCF